MATLVQGTPNQTMHIIVASLDKGLLIAKVPAIHLKLKSLHSKCTCIAHLCNKLAKPTKCLDEVNSLKMKSGLKVN